MVHRNSYKGKNIALVLNLVVEVIKKVRVNFVNINASIN